MRLQFTCVRILELVTFHPDPRGSKKGVLMSPRSRTPHERKWPPNHPLMSKWWIRWSHFLPQRRGRIWSGQMLYEMGIHETITSLFGENHIHQSSVAAAHAAATLSEDSQNKRQPYQKPWSFFVFSKQSQIQNVNVVHVLVWHLQSTHRIRSWDCCSGGVVGYGGGGLQ